MSELITYPLLKKSVLDQSVPQNWIKIRISECERTKYGDNFNGIKVAYCSLNICNSEKKPCQCSWTGCPYQDFVMHERPRSNNKEYEKYIEEYRLQITQKTLNNFKDERILKYLNGELENWQYKSLVKFLATKISISNNLNCDPIFNDIRKEINFLKSQKNIHEKEKRRVIYDIGEYYYITVSHLPQYKINNKSIWHQLNAFDAWIIKENLTVELFNYIKSIRMESYLQKDYDDNIQKLEEQMDEYYGLITMFKLL